MYYNVPSPLLERKLYHEHLQLYLIVRTIFQFGMYRFKVRELIEKLEKKFYEILTTENCFLRLITFPSRVAMRKNDLLKIFSSPSVSLI